MRRRRNPYPGVTRTVDRHGKVRWRFRKAGLSSCYLVGEYDSAEFRRSYEAALLGKAIERPRINLQPFTYDWLIERYLQTPEFLRIGPIYKRNLSLEFERFRRKYGKGDFRTMNAARVELMMARMVDTPAAANKLRKLLKRLARFAIKREWATVDPTLGVKPFPTNPDGYYTWTEDDISRFESRHLIGSKAHLALHLILATGAARQDVIALGWQSIQSERISYRRKKTGQDVSFPLSKLPDLCRVLELCDRGAMLFITHGKGRAYNPETFGSWFKRQCREAGIHSDASAHGLRKAGATRLANAGGTEFEVMAYLAHKTTDEARTYVKAANRSKLTDSGLDKVNSVSNPVVRLDKSGSK